MHEAAHKLLFTNKRWNDWIGKWVVASPVFTPVQLYRRVHLAHHKDEFGPDEPDMAFYSPYPVHAAGAATAPLPGCCRHQRVEELRPAGQEHAPQALPPHRSLHLRRPGPAVGRDVGCHRTLVDLPAPVVPALDDRVARHQPPALHRGARRMERSSDRRATTHNVRQSWPARFWIVPYNTGWHLAHHVDMGVPWRICPPSTPSSSAGYITDAITYKNYRALWRALSSADETTEDKAVAARPRTHPTLIPPAPTRRVQPGQERGRRGGTRRPPASSHARSRASRRPATPSWRRGP